MCARGVCRASVYRAPDLLQQRVVAQQPSPIPYQSPEELELDRCQVDLVTVAAHDTCREVDFETVELRAWFLDLGLGSSQLCEHAATSSRG
jgi:hypothetical protein